MSKNPYVFCVIIVLLILRSFVQIHCHIYYQLAHQKGTGVRIQFVDRFDANKICHLQARSLADPHAYANLLTEQLQRSSLFFVDQSI
jgi:hypothetical protein